MEKNNIEEKELFEKAYILATEVHKNQTRDEGTPYITHIDAILHILKDELNDDDYRKWTVVALHDVLEDSNKYSYDDLVEIFDKEIADQVKLLTKTKGLKIEDYLNNMENYEYSSVVIKIKLSDRLHNVRSLKNIVDTKPDKIKKYVIETKKYYIPLAKKYNSVLYDKITEALKDVE